MAATQLFVGRLPRNTRSRDMEDIFYRYGKMTRCDIKQGSASSLVVLLHVKNCSFHFASVQALRWVSLSQLCAMKRY